MGTRGPAACQADRSRPRGAVGASGSDPERPREQSDERMPLRRRQLLRMRQQPATQAPVLKGEVTLPIPAHNRYAEVGKWFPDAYERYSRNSAEILRVNG